MADQTNIPEKINASYAVWTPDTNITLCNVPWDNQYRDIIDWKTVANRTKYFSDLDGQNVTAKFERAGYARVDMPVRLEIGIDRAMNYNYVRIQNPGYPGAVGPTEYFYFVTGVTMLNPKVTLFTLQLDVWTTYGPAVRIGQAYVEQGHIGIANANQFSNFGRDFLMVPEGMDTGNEYQNVYHVNRDIITVKDLTHDSNTYVVLIASTIDLSADAGTVTNPKLITAPGSNAFGLPSGATYYTCNPAMFSLFMKKVAQTPWVSQGIISITAVPSLSSYGVQLEGVTTGPGANMLYSFKPNSPQHGRSYNMLNNWRNSDAILNNIPAKYRKLKKFLTSPYMMLELTTWSGNPAMLKPELWNDPHAWISERPAILPPSARIAFIPVKYNAGRGSTIVEQENGAGNGGYLEDNGEYKNVAVQVENMPSFALVNNGYLSAMASQAHSFAMGYTSADWSQQKALAGNQTSYDQATNSMDTNWNNGVTGMDAQRASLASAQGYAWQTTGMNAGLAVARGLQGGPTGVLGGLGEAAIGVAGQAMAQNQQSAQQGIALGAQGQTMDNNYANAEYLRDSNKSLADWSANGDYAMAIKAQNAKAQDMRMTQPTTSGMQGGEVFNLLNGGIELSLRFKMISYNAMCMIGDYWLRYGYAIQRFLRVDKLSVMTKFTYWKMSEVYLINTNLPEFHKQAIRGIFEKGVTVRLDPRDIGYTDISDNEPLPGIVIPVDPDPIPYEPPVIPLVPNNDEVEKVYLINVANNIWTVGKEYLADNSTLTVPTATIQKVTGVEPVSLTAAEFAQTLSALNIPTNYADRTVFLTDYPNGIYSASDELAVNDGDLADGIAANGAKLDALSVLIPNEGA